MKAGEGIVSTPSRHSVAETVDRLEELLRLRGIKVFARIDHAGEAAAVGLTMPPTQLLVFGNPNAGTPLMLAAPTAAIDLPLKALAWEDELGRVWLSHSAPSYLAKRFELGEEAITAIAAIGGLLEQAAH